MSKIIQMHYIKWRRVLFREYSKKGFCLRLYHRLFVNKIKALPKIMSAVKTM